MKSKKKIVTLVLCAVLLVAGSVMGTMAWLTSQTEVVKNTFSVGNVTITLDETDVNEYGVKESDTPVQGNDYKLIPGHNYIKNPTVHVDASSEPCWVFVEVTNGIAAYEAATNTIADQMEANGWTPLEGNVYAYAGATVPGGKDLPVFGTFTIANNAEIPESFNGTVTIKAYAVQADNFATAAAAWAASFGESL